MTAATFMIAAMLWSGLALLLMEIPWVARARLVDRLAPYRPGTTRVSGHVAPASWKFVVGPVLDRAGATLARTLGIHDTLQQRLRRVHAGIDPTQFRLRQLTWGLGGMCAGLTVATGARLPVVMAIVVCVALTFAALLGVEQQLVGADAAHRQARRQQLPVMSEQVGMLVASGYSVPAALDRVAQRQRGVIATDLALVVARIRRGAEPDQALHEWAQRVRVDSIDRFVSVLALDRQASDLGQLIATETRNIRRDLHRDVIATLEKRSQQVWVPVTVATMLPGAMFIGVPFIAALDQFLVG